MKIFCHVQHCVELAVELITACVNLNTLPVVVCNASVEFCHKIDAILFFYPHKASKLHKVQDDMRN